MEALNWHYSRILVVAVSACLLLGGCASAPPQNKEDICQLFFEKRAWYRDARKASKRWGAPIPVMMSFMYQESGFEARAKPPRRKILWIIPWTRPASAKGYSQAINETWSAYKKATGRWAADRNDFGDAVDFLGWYIDQSYRANKIAKDDAYNGYLAYHEGQGGFADRSFRKKKWLTDVAHEVSARAATYASQLRTCEKQLRRPWYIRMLPFL